jgi:hypothetical protein
MTKADFNCDCGKSYRHYPSLYKHQKRHRHGKYSDAPTQGDGGESTTSAQDENNQSSDSPPSPPQIDDAVPQWTNFTFEAEIEDDATTPIPTVLKNLKRHGKGKKVSNMTGAERESQKRIIGIGYRSVDGLLERYGQAVTDNPDYSLTRASTDYEWVSGLTLDMCEEQGWSGIPISATGLWVIGSVYWVGKPVAEIQSKRVKSLSSSGGFLSRLPIIGRLMKRRKNKQVRDIISNLPPEVEGDESGTD